MVTVGSALTVTVTGVDVDGQPAGDVTVTVNVPEAMTVIDGVVAPLLQRYDAPQEFALRVTLPPAQNEVGPAGVMTAAGNGLTVTVTGADVAGQAATSNTVTV